MASRSRTSGQSHFAAVPVAEIPRSSFDRSHGHKTTFDAGLLIPIFLDEALPGDTFTVKMTGFARLATPIFPLMDNMYMDTHFFAVPLRLVWENFVKQCGEQDAPGDSTDFTEPQIVLSGADCAPHTLADYFGIPAVASGTTSVSALPFRAYARIYNDWYRDENLQNPPLLSTGNGPDLIANYDLYRRGKRHDYFTSCLPWPQKGTAVTLPLGTSATVKTATTELFTAAGPTVNFRSTTGTVPGTALTLMNTAGGTLSQSNAAATAGGLGGLYPSNLYADLSTATAATVNQLRQAFQLQRMFERDARGGTRYTEVIRSHFGVTSPDARLQRPEYLGGGTGFVNIAAVAQTSATDVTGSTTPQANLSGIGTAVLNNHGFTKSFTEHCIIIGLLSVRSDYTYQQGIERMWLRRTRFDRYWPALSHIGEQAVTTREIYSQNDSTLDDVVFGYQERYAEYRYKPSRVSGLFKSSAPASLDAWHLAQEFTAAPALNAAFIVEDPPVDRVIAVPSEPHFIMDMAFSMRCARPMPVYGVPGMMDHF